MYIGLHKITSQKEKDGLVTVTLKDKSVHTFNKELFDLIATKEITNNGDKPYDVVVHTIASAICMLTKKYDLTIMEALNSIQTASHLVELFRNEKVAKIFKVDNVTHIKMKDII